jgi:hypothetical protein
MILDKLDLLKMKADSFRRVLEKSPERAKTSHVTISMSEEFNRLVYDVASSFPEVTDSLPKKIPKFIGGFATAKLIELEILSAQLVGILDLLISKRM